ncbi:hypothetical protein QQG55_7725 [Brugia pahangi]
MFNEFEYKRLEKKKNLNCIYVKKLWFYYRLKTSIDYQHILKGRRLCCIAIAAQGRKAAACSFCCIIIVIIIIIITVINIIVIIPTIIKSRKLQYDTTTSSIGRLTNDASC